MTTVTLDGVRKVYSGGKLAVDDLRLRVEDGEFLVLLGPSGCGKTTVLRMIAGLEPLTSGSIWLGDDLVNELSPRERDVAMVFQHGALYPHMDVRGNLGFPLLVGGAEESEIGARVGRLAEALEIGETLTRQPHTLSGGQRQRVAMGRAIIREPRLFLMDEPLSNLDATLRTELRSEIADLVRSLGTTTVYVTHDQVEALTLADRVAVLRAGTLQDVGTPQQIYHDPATAFVAAFLSSPPIGLLRASVLAEQGERAGIILGSQHLDLPWSDPRAAHLAAHYGADVTVGIRSDALTPVAEPVPGRTLSGRIRFMEYHGHEWLAHITVDVDAVELTEPNTHVSEDADGGGLGARLRRMVGITGTRPGGEPLSSPEPVQAGAHRGRAEVAVRVAGRGTARIGELVHMDVDLASVFLFDASGRRIEPIRR